MIIKHYFTSDHHADHNNIIRYTGRPFADVAEMQKELAQRWNAVVRPVDIVWVLGDLFMGGDFSWVAQLNGHIKLLPGNHDKCWPLHPRRPNWRRYLPAYEAASIEVMPPVWTLQDPGWDIPGHTLLMNHFPYTGDRHDQDRYEAARQPDTGLWLLHGHTHGKWRQKGHQIDVGVDAWGGRPVALDQLVAMAGAGEGDLSPIPW